MNSIEESYYLVENVVSHYKDHRRDDMRCVGNLALVEAWPERPEGEKEIPWLVSRIKYAILGFFEDDNLIRVPYRSRERHGLAIRVSEIREDDAQRTDDSLGLALADLPVESTEREIIRLLVEGYSMAEIAKIMDTNAMNICRRVKIIREKLSTYFKD